MILIWHEVSGPVGYLASTHPWVVVGGPQPLGRGGGATASTFNIVLVNVPKQENAEKVNVGAVTLELKQT